MAARSLAAECLALHQIDMVKTHIMDRACNDPEPRPATLKEALACVDHARKLMLASSRIRFARACVQAGRANKVDRRTVEKAEPWMIYMLAKANILLSSIDGAGSHFERTSKELKKFDRYYRRVWARRNRAVAALEAALATNS